MSSRDTVLQWRPAQEQELGKPGSDRRDEKLHLLLCQSGDKGKGHNSTQGAITSSLEKGKEKWWQHRFPGSPRTVQSETPPLGYEPEGPHTWLNALLSPS